MAQADLDALLQAYEAAGRALDRGMRRRGGATDAEWQAEEDARIQLRAARRAYIGGIREMINESAANRRRADAAAHNCDRKGPPAEVVHESGDQPGSSIYPTCSICGVPQIFRS
jgi:hypothetical protein